MYPPGFQAASPPPPLPSSKYGWAISALIIIAFIFWIYVLSTIPVDVKRTPRAPIDSYTQYLAHIGKQTHEYDNFIAQLKKDGNIEQHKISTYIGPYFIHEFIIGRLETNDYDIYDNYLIIDRDFLDILTPITKKALIAHEIGHLTGLKEANFNRFRILPKFDRLVTEQIKADNFAIRHVGVDAVLDLLTNLYEYNPEHRRRIDNINIFKKLREMESDKPKTAQ